MGVRVIGTGKPYYDGDKLHTKRTFSMSTEPIKVDANTDLLVAGLVGIRAEIRYSTSPAGLQSPENAYCVRLDTSKQFSPTTCADDAREAARRMLDSPLAIEFMDCLWYRLKLHSDSTRYAILRELIENGPKVICEAIKAVAEKGDS